MRVTKDLGPTTLEERPPMILFYAPKDPYGFFSNFSRHPIKYMNRVWPTSEHAFQAMKFWPHREDLVDAVQKAETPTRATELGRDRRNPIRSDWDRPPTEHLFNEHRVPCIVKIAQPDDGVYRAGVDAEPLFARIKDVFMYEICLEKVKQYPEIADALRSTNEQPIIEDALHDPYWGWGASRVGQNKLGRVFMAIRSDLA